MDKIEKVKLMLNYKDISDELLEWYFEVIEQRVLMYCHRDDIPYGLELIIIQMVADYANNVERIKQVNLPENQDNTSNKSISSITRGDTTISYSDKNTSLTSANGIKIDYSATEFVNDYKEHLIKYRKLKTI